MTEKVKASVEQKKWYKNTLALVTLIGALVAVVAGLTQIFSSLKKTPPSGDHLEIVVDRSAGMNQLFGDTTKRSALSRALEDFLYTEDEVSVRMALRQFGGACSDEEGESTRLLVKFGTRNKRKIFNKLKKMKIEGEATLYRGLAKTIGDFDAPELIGAKDIKKRVLVITGGNDTCVENAGDRIKKKMSERGISLDFSIIGIGLNPEDRKSLAQMAKSLGGELIAANNTKQLHVALLAKLEIEPVLEDAGRIVEIIDRGMNELNSILKLISGKKYKEAEIKIDKARATLSVSQQPLRDLAGRQNREQYVALSTLAHEVREEQEALIELIAGIVVHGANEDWDNYDKAVKAYNQARQAPNKKVAEINNLIKKIAKLRET